MKQFGRAGRWLAGALAMAFAVGMLAQEKREATANAPEKKAALEGKLPSAKEVLDRYVKEIGGAEAYEKHKSQHAVGVMEMAAQGVKGKMEVFSARPNKLLIKIEMPGVGEVTTGFDGKVGWMSNPLTGPMLLPEKMLKQLTAQADFDHTLHLPEDYTTMEMLGKEEFGDEPCYKLKLAHKSGFDSTEYFSVKSGLQRGFVAAQDSPLGEVTVTTLVGDYKKFDGLLLPTKMTQKMSGIESTMTFTTLEFDSVPDSTFELPEEVKAMIEKPADKPADKPSEKAAVEKP